MNIAKMKVGARLGLGFGLVLVLLVILAGLGMLNMGEINRNLYEISRINNVQISLAVEMRETVNNRMIALRNLALLTEMAEMQPEAERIKREAVKYDEAEKKLAEMFAALPQTTSEEKALMAKIKEEANAILPLIAKSAELGLANKAEEATSVLIKEVRPVQLRLMEALSQLVKLEEKLNDQATTAAEKSYDSARTMMWVLSAVAVLIGSAAAFVITRGLLTQLGGEPDYAAAIAGSIASGDLTVEVETKANDHSSLLFAMKAMRDSLVNIVGEVRNGTDTIASASQQIASGNADLSSRTEEQASSLEETASSMEELTSTVKQNADNARQANSLAQTASEVAVKGGTVVSEVVGTMGAINESAKKIVDIIGVIDGIAFQTNILALNAAVEAARAGEQGRGFAVVASEVRNLAQRSAAAAKEIKALIGNSVEKVDAGSRLVDQAGATMQEVVESIRRVTDIMAEISAASQEQTTGIEQINQAITQMDQATQQNASLVEESAAASEAMQEQAGKLAQVVSVFKLNGMQRTAMAAPAKPKAMAAPAKVKAGTVPMAKKPAVPAPSSRDPRQVKRLATAGATSNNDWEEF